jgi:hypothetical protein
VPYSEARHKDLAAECSFNEVHRTGGGYKLGAFHLVRLQRCINFVGWQAIAQLGADRSVAVPSSFDPGVGVMPCDDGQGDWVAVYRLLLAVAPWQDVEQPLGFPDD